MRTITLVLLLLTPLSAQSQTAWLASSISVAPPPAAAQTRREITQMIEAQRSLSAERHEAIRYWDAGAPGYRWNQIAYDLARDSEIPVERVYALLNVAIYDATLATSRARNQYPRKRPYEMSRSITPLVPAPNGSAYPSAHAAAAGAAASVLSYLFPSKAADIQDHAKKCGQSRVDAGVQYASDVVAGMQIGRDAGARVIEWAKHDGSDAVWHGTVPTEAGKWKGTDPASPALATWKTWTLPSPDALRPPPPPAFGKDAVEEVEDPSINTGPHRRAAYAWAVVSLARYWNERAALTMFEHKTDRDPLRAARVYAVLSTSYYDALVACWDGKYAYWGARPNQVDPQFKPLIPTPNFPGYPSGHATLAADAAAVLSAFFPDEAATFSSEAEEAASSRLWAGVHFRIDNEIGIQLGRRVAQMGIERARRDGGSLTTP